jgi:protein-tyrosine phosphatase
MGEGPRDKIVFICSGNTCRSPMAQVFLEGRARDIPEIARYGVTSAGLWAHDGQKSFSEARVIMRGKGYSLEDHRARVLTQAMVDGAAAIICMTLAHEKVLRENFTNLPNICTSFAEFGGDIADPCAGNLEVYGKIADEIEQKLLSIVIFLRKELHDY